MTTFVTISEGGKFNSTSAVGVVENDMYGEKRISENANTTNQPTKSAVEVLSNLIAEKDAWFNNAYKTSNEQLYSLLSKCYEFYEQLKQSGEDANKLRKGLDAYIAEKNYKFSTGSHTLTKIVKCVFGADRRRVSAYSIVLRTALAKQLKVAEIADFIRQSGGVEEVRLMKSPNSLTVKQKAEAGAKTLTSKTITTVVAAEFKESLDAGNIGKAVVLIGTWNADGSISVNSFTNSTSAVNTALAAHFAKDKTEVDAKKSEGAAANENLMKKEAVDKAVSESEYMPLAA